MASLKEGEMDSVCDVVPFRGGDGPSSGPEEGPETRRVNFGGRTSERVGKRWEETYTRKICHSLLIYALMHDGVGA